MNQAPGSDSATRQTVAGTIASIDDAVTAIARRVRIGATGPSRPRNFRRHQAIGVSLFALIVWAVVTFLVSALNTIGLIQLWLFYTILGVGFYLSFAMAGRIAVCQAFFAGLGAYASAWASRTQPFFVGLAFALVVTALLSLLLALLLSRSGHFYFAIATLGLAEIGITVFFKWEAFTGPSGQVSGIRPISFFGHAFRSSDEVVWVLLGASCLCLLLVALLERSPMRRSVIATRDLPTVASVSGIPIEAYKVGFFVLGSVMAGLAGSLFAHWQVFLAPESFGIDLSIGLFLMVILGGSRSPWGVVLGAAFYVWAPQYLKRFEEWQSVIYGALLMIIIIVLPEGLIGLGQQAGRLVARFARNRRGTRFADA